MATATGYQYRQLTQKTTEKTPLLNRKGTQKIQIAELPQKPIVSKIDKIEFSDSKYTHLLKMGTRQDLLDLIPKEHLLLPDPNCHLEIQVSSTKKLESVTSCKNNLLQSNDGTYHSLGKRHGLTTEYQDDGVTKKNESHWKDGKQNGLTIAYQADGVTKKSESHWKDGKQNGLTIAYQADGVN